MNINCKQLGALQAICSQNVFVVYMQNFYENDWKQLINRSSITMPLAHKYRIMIFWKVQYSHSHEGESVRMPKFVILKQKIWFTTESVLMAHMYDADAFAIFTQSNLQYTQQHIIYAESYDEYT